MSKRDRKGKKISPEKKHQRNAHTRERAKERYDVNLKEKDRKKIARMIVERKGSFQCRSGECSVWIVVYNGVAMKVVYNETFRNLQTVLPITEPEFGADDDNPFKELMDIRKDLPRQHKPKQRGRKK